MSSTNRQKRNAATSKKWPANEPLPKFATMEEEEAFYATHDLSDLFDAAEKVEPNPMAKSNLRDRPPKSTNE